jgi:hypothetical protein
MAEIVKQDNDLVAIKVSLDVSAKPSKAPSVLFEVERAGERRHMVSISADKLGVPSDFNPPEHRYGEPAFAMPNGLLGELRAEFDRALGPDQPQAVWLHIASPSGFLPLLPWERMLGATFDRPVIRVPHFALFPTLDSVDLDVALCISQPRSKEPFDAVSAGKLVVNRLLSALPGKRTIHVFSDAEAFQQLRAALKAQTSNGGPVRLYDPADAPTTAIPDLSSSAPAGTWDPWLHWIAHQTRDLTLEAVQFVGHTYLAKDQAALAFAESPVRNVDKRWARFIGPNQIASFLDVVGAWAVGFTTPSQNFSPMAARLLIDDIAHLHAGPVLHHDLGRDPTGEAFAATTYSIFNSNWPSLASEVALYCHPRIFRSTSSGDTVPYAGQLLADPRIGGPEAVETLPAWVTLTRRYLEQSTARLFPDVEEPTSAVQIAAGEGVRQALSFVGQVISSMEIKDDSGSEPEITRQGSDALANSERPEAPR